MMNYAFSVLFMFFKNPLSKGYMLLLMTISTSMTASTMFMNSWFGYILFLIMVGGMLVAFIYMTSTASNEKFSYPKVSLSIMYLMMLILTMVMIWKFMFPMNYSFMTNSQELENFMNLPLSKLFYKPLNYLPLMLMSYLLLTLIMVVKMTEFIKGPIRQK
uniref:NADH-ubiquinone oxidoreductase chain 6 n=1 Tax=Scolytinae sp. BMNH 1040174 TaxID=1903786 RepID=A0A343A612_9CUCU|nr:NADH dehydrogenase subunit 6 [Scolytinae sp. BMNH 1040174]